jgi:hypothetical protein
MEADPERAFSAAGIVAPNAPATTRNPLFALFSAARYPAPFSMFHDKPGSIPGRGADTLGFVNRSPPSIPKPPGETRVFVFGNSAVRDGGEQSISATLERQFSAAGRPNVRVYNFGIASGICRQSVMFMADQGIDLSPDLVITYDGYVDLAIPMTYDPRPGYPYNHYMLEIMHEYLGSGRIQELDLPKAERQRRDDLRAAIGWRSPEWCAAIVQSYVSSLRRMHEFGKFYGFSVYSCIQPVLVTKMTRIGAEAKYKRSAPGELLIRDLFTSAQSAIGNLRTELAGQRNRFGDFSHFFADDVGERFRDMSHVNLAAHELIAEKLHAEVRELV